MHLIPIPLDSLSDNILLQLNPAMAYTSPSSLTASAKPLPISSNTSKTWVIMLSHNFSVCID